MSLPHLPKAGRYGGLVLEAHRLGEKLSKYNTFVDDSAFVVKADDIHSPEVSKSAILIFAIQIIPIRKFLHVSFRHTNRDSAEILTGIYPEISLLVEEPPEKAANDNSSYKKRHN